MGFVVENPASSRMWDTSSMSSLRSEATVHAVHLHHCMFGGRRPKHTMLLNNLPEMTELSVQCRGGHVHAPWGHYDNDGNWVFGTAEEAEYPEELCTAVASCILRARGRAEGETVGAALGRWKGKAGRRRRAARGLLRPVAVAAGRQPRGQTEALLPELPLDGVMAGSGAVEGACPFAGVVALVLVGPGAWVDDDLDDEDHGIDDKTGGNGELVGADVQK